MGFVPLGVRPHRPVSDTHNAEAYKKSASLSNQVPGHSKALDSVQVYAYKSRGSIHVRVSQ